MLIIMLGVQSVYHRSRLGKAYVTRGLLVILVLGLIVGFVEKQSFKYIIEPFEHEDNRSSLLYISNHQEKKRTVICTQHAVPAYDYYSRHDENYNFIDVGPKIEMEYNSDIVAEALRRLEKEEKVWILANHYSESAINSLIDNTHKVAQIENSYRAKNSVAICISKKDLSNKK